MSGLVDLYGWHVVLTPELLVIVAVVALLYAKAGNIQPLNGGSFVPLPWTRQVSFYGGLICMYFGFGGVLAVLAKESIDVYVLQLCVRYMCMIPLLIAGTPEWIRKGVVSRIRGGQKLLWSEKYGMYAALIFFLTLSVMLLPFVYNTLLTIPFLRFLVHILLLISAWFMWESLLRPGLIPYQRKKIRSNLMMLGSVVLFPVCLVMIGSNYQLYAYSQSVISGLCISPNAGGGSIFYRIDSTSAFGGILLMAAPQLSLSLTAQIVVATSSKEIKQ